MRDYLDFEEPLKELEGRIERVSKSGLEKRGVPRLIRMLQGQLQKKEISTIKYRIPIFGETTLFNRPNTHNSLLFLSGKATHFTFLFF